MNCLASNSARALNAAMNVFPVRSGDEKGCALGQGDSLEGLWSESSRLVPPLPPIVKFLAVESEIVEAQQTRNRCIACSMCIVGSADGGPDIRARSGLLFG